MTRKRSSPMGLEILLPVLLAFIILPLSTQAAPLQDYTEIQQYTEGCYYNYNHYNEGDRILTNEPCLNCTCHNKMLMCYLRVCPFTKPIGHDCIVEKREDQCCPIITCPEVPVDVAHTVSETGTELSFPEKYGCSIDSKFYLEGAQVPSNPNKPCELCYCIKNRTSCLMQECTLHIDGCTPIYNKGSCCPVRYNCDHENDVLELEDHSSSTEAATTTTTERPTTGFIISSTMTPAVSTDCIHNKEVYADGARIEGETACENCYCMRGDIVCAVQECHMPMLKDNGKLCHPLPAVEGECCPSNYVCEDDTSTTEFIETTTLLYHTLDEETKLTTAAPVKDLHSGIPEEDLQLQTHIDEEDIATKTPLPTEDEKETDVPSVRKPIAAENEQDTEKESTTKYNFKAEATTVSSSGGKPKESDEIVTTVPTLSDISDESEVFATAVTSLSDKHAESTTEIPSGDQDEDQTEKSTKYPSLEDQKETDTVVPTDTSELPKISTSTNEEYTTASSAENKFEIKELVTSVPVTEVEHHSATDLTPTEEKETDESTESVEEIKSVVDEGNATKTPNVSEKIDITEVNEKESKPFESDDSAAETSELEKEPVESATKSSLDVESTTEREVEQQTESKIPLSVADLATETPVTAITYEQSTKISTEIEEEGPLKATPEDSKTITEENVDATTRAPEKLASEENNLSTEEPKETQKPKYEEEKQQEEGATLSPPISDDHERSTELPERNEPVISTETSVEAEEGKVTKLPISAEEKPYVTSHSNIEEDEEGITTTLPTIVDSIPGKEEHEVLEEAKPMFDEEENLDITTEAAIKSVDHTIPTAETKPMFDDEMGSGGDNIEIAPENTSDTPVTSPTKEPLASISHEQEEQEYTTGKPIAPAKEKPAEQNISNESSGESGESAESTESEEDNKLLDLTTAKPSESDATTNADEITKDHDKQIKITTTKPFVTAEAVTEELEPVKDKQPSDETTSEENIDVTTISALLDEKLSTVEQEINVELKDKLIEDTEDTTALTIEEAVKHENGVEVEKTEIPDDLENVTTQKAIEELDQQTSTAQTFATISEGEDDEQKVLPESDDNKIEEPTRTTGSPMVTIEDKLESTTPNPNAETIIRKEDNGEVEKHSPDIKGDFEEQPSTTKPLVEPSRAEEIPVMQLPSSIPGEGDCLVGQRTFENNSIVPTSDECEVVCKCVSSIVACERVKCSIPENIGKCTLDESSTNKCCPTYICNAIDFASIKHDSPESIEEYKDDKLQYSTSPSATGEEQSTTIKPASHAIKPGMKIPEIEMNVAFTEEPMSHVKDEDESELHTSTQVVPAISEDKNDVLASTGDIIVPQSMTPVEISEKEYQQEKPKVITGEQTIYKISDVEPEIGHTVNQEQPKIEFEEHTTFAHEFVESSTVSTTHVPSDKKQENEIQSTSNVPAADEYQTVKPFEEEEGSGDEKTEVEIQTVIPSLPAGDEVKTSEEHQAIDLSSEEDKEPEIKTDKTKISESTEKPSSTDTAESHFDQELEMQTTYPKISTDSPLDSETTTPSIEISTEAGEQQTSKNVVSKDIIASSTAATSSKDHDTKSDAEDMTITTTFSSIDESKYETSTGKQTSDKIEDIDTSFEESTSTLASVTEKVSEIDPISSEVMPDKYDKEDVKPSEKEQDVEVTTVLSTTDYDKTNTPVKTADDKILEHTIGHDEHKEMAEGPSSTTYQPEIHSNIAHTDDHTIAPAVEEYEDKNEEKEIYSTTTAAEGPSSTTYQPEIHSNIAHTDDHTTAPAVEEYEDKNEEKEIYSTATAAEGPSSTTYQPEIHSNIAHTDDHTIVPAVEEYEDKNEEKEIYSTTTSAEGPSSTTYQPEIHSNIAHTDDHTIVPAVEEYEDKNEEKEIYSTTTAAEGPSSTTYQPEIHSNIAHTDDHTIVPAVEEYEDKNEEKEIYFPTTAAEGPSSTTYQPEIQTHISHSDDKTIASADEEYDDKNAEKDVYSATTPVPDDKTSSFITTPISEYGDVATEKPADFGTKLDSSTLTPSTEEEMAHISTTVSIDVEKTDKNKETEEIKTPDYFTERPGEQQTETEEMEESTVASSTDAEQTEEEIVTKSSVEHVKEDVEISLDHIEGSTSVEGEELITKTPQTLQEIEPQEGDENTISPLTSDEHATETILSKEELLSVKKDDIVPELQDNKPDEQSTTTATNHISTKQPSFETFEEGSGDSVESEEEVSTESKIYDTTEKSKISDQQGINEVPADKTAIGDKKPITETPISNEIISEQSIDEDSIPSITKAPIEDPHRNIQSETDIMLSVNEEELTGEHDSTEKPMEIELSTSVQDETESEVGLTDETEDQNMLSVTQATTKFEDKDDLSTTNAPISAHEIEAVTVKHLQEESVHEVNKTADIERYTEQPEEQNIGFSTVKTPLPFDEAQYITDKYPIENINVVDSTKSPSASEDVDFATPQGLDETESEKPKIIESVTTKFPSDQISEGTTDHIPKLPFDEILGETTTHIPSQEVEQNKEEFPEIDIETETAKTPEKIDTVSGSRAPTETTTKLPSEGDDNLDVTKAPEYLDKEVTSTKLPVHDEEDFGTAVTQLPTSEIEDKQESDAISDKATEVSLVPQSEISESITGVPSKDSHTEESNIGSTGLPMTPKVSTEKLQEIEDQTTEQTAHEHFGETTYAPEDKLHTHVTESPTKDTKFDEKSHEETTELSAGAHFPTELTENVTQLPAENAATEVEITHEGSTHIPMGSHIASDDIKHEEESGRSTTELPYSVTLRGQDIDLTDKEIHTEDDKYYKQTTGLPTYSHISTETVAQDITVSPVKDIVTEEESTVLSVEKEVTTDKLQEHITEITTQSLEENLKETDEKESHGHDIHLPEDVQKSTEVLSEHTTELPTKDIQTEKVEHELAGKLSEHSTEAPSNDVESEEDVYEKPTDISSDKLPTKDEELHEESYEKATELPVVAHDVSTTGHAFEQTTENLTKAEESFKETSTEAAEDISGVKLNSATTVHPLFAHHSTLSSAAIDSRIDEGNSQSTSSPAKNEEILTTSTTTAVSTTEEITTSAPHYQPQPPIYGHPPQYGPTQYEDEYTDEDEAEVFGPGTCRYGGKLYVSAQQIPRDDPCDFCFCFRSDIICLQQSCPPPISGCHEEPISGFCCPRYECPVSMATVLNITTSTTTTSTTLPPHFLHHSYGSNVQRNGCLINGRSYRVGEKIESTSGPCINCSCGGDGKMKCDPQACVPEPTMQQVMAVVAAGRKR